MVTTLLTHMQTTAWVSTPGLRVLTPVPLRRVIWIRSTVNSGLLRGMVTIRILHSAGRTTAMIPSMNLDLRRPPILSALSVCNP